MNNQDLSPAARNAVRAWLVTCLNSAPLCNAFDQDFNENISGKIVPVKGPFDKTTVLFFKWCLKPMKNAIKEAEANKAPFLNLKREP